MLMCGSDAGFIMRYAAYLGDILIIIPPENSPWNGVIRV
jgi:hypothetical protein